MGWNAIGIARGFNGDDEQIDEMLEKVENTVKVTR